MKFGTSIIIFLLALVALAAEVFLYFSIGISSLALSTGESQFINGAYLFVLLMIMTASAGILAPICAVIELLIKKENSGVYAFIILMLIIPAVYALGLIDANNNEQTDTLSDSSSIAPEPFPSEKSKQLLSEEDDEEKELAEYIDKVKLYDMTAKYYSTYSDDRVPGVNFKLKNEGKKTLRKVQVTFYFMDQTGTIIAEEDYTPVLVSKYSYGDNKPLKPNYIWQNEAGSFYKAKNVPTEWKEGLFKAEVTEIDFLED